MLPAQITKLIPSVDDRDVDAKDVARILQATLKAYADDEIKLDALTGVSSWARKISEQASGKQKEASINKEKIRTKFYGDADL